MASEPEPSLRWESVHKPARVTSRDAGYQKRVIVAFYIAWV